MICVYSSAFYFQLQDISYLATYVAVFVLFIDNTYISVGDIMPFRWHTRLCIIAHIIMYHDMTDRERGGGRVGGGVAEGSDAIILW